MPWIARVLLLALKTKRGRKLLLVGGIRAIEFAGSKRARLLVARLRTAGGR